MDYLQLPVPSNVCIWGAQEETEQSSVGESWDWSQALFSPSRSEIELPCLYSAPAKPRAQERTSIFSTCNLEHQGLQIQTDTQALPSFLTGFLKASWQSHIWGENLKECTHEEDNRGRRDWRGVCLQRVYSCGTCCRGLTGRGPPRLCGVRMS